MPALPPVPSVLKCSFQHTMGTVPAWVHWYFRYTGSAPATADAAAIANSLKSAYVTNCIPLLYVSATLQLIQVTDLSSATGAQNNSSGTVAGTRTGSSLTANDCVLINQHITRRYRGGHPRQYWPWGAGGDLASGQTWSTTFQSAVGAAINAMVTAAEAITWAGGQIANPVNVSYYQGFTVVTSPTTGRAHNVPKLRSSPVVDTIASSSVNARVATQRRRQHFSA